MASSKRVVGLDDVLVAGGSCGNGAAAEEPQMNSDGHRWTRTPRPAPPITSREHKAPPLPTRKLGGLPSYGSDLRTGPLALGSGLGFVLLGGDWRCGAGFVAGIWGHRCSSVDPVDLPRLHVDGLEVARGE